MDLTAALRAFVRTVERGSITAAARDLGVSQPAVSKLLRNLEEHAGARLLERTTRAVSPTPQGLALYEASGASLAVIDAAVEAIRSDMGNIGGTLRLHGPVCLGESHLHGIVADFQRHHPAVTVDLTLGKPRRRPRARKFRRGRSDRPSDGPNAHHSQDRHDQENSGRGAGISCKAGNRQPLSIAARPQRHRHRCRVVTKGDANAVSRWPIDGGFDQARAADQQRTGLDLVPEGRTWGRDGATTAGRR